MTVGGAERTGGKRRHLNALIKPEDRAAARVRGGKTEHTLQSDLGKKTLLEENSV